MTCMYSIKPRRGLPFTRKDHPHAVHIHYPAPDFEVTPIKTARHDPQLQAMDEAFGSTDDMFSDGPPMTERQAAADRDGEGGPEFVRLLVAAAIIVSVVVYIVY